MEYLLEHWRGECSVSRAGWLGSFVAILLVMPTNILEVHSFMTLNHIYGYSDLMMRVQDGTIAG